MIDVILVDDQQLIVDLLTIGLQQSNEICVVATANNGLQARELALQYQPDVVLMDIMMPECDGIRATRDIKALNSNIKVLVLTNGDKDTDLQKALDAGADGYVLKNISQQDLLLAVKGVCANMKIVTPGNRPPHQVPVEHHVFTGKHLHKYERQVMINGEAVLLTPRDLALINMIVESQEVTEMAELLELSEGSVRNLISSLIHKLQVKDRTQLAVFALKNQLVDSF